MGIYIGPQVVIHTVELDMSHFGDDSQHGRKLFS